MAGISDFFSSLLPTVHNDEDKDKAEDKPESEDGKDEKSEGENSAEPEPEEEEEEPEDDQPKLREEAKQSPKCAGLVQHFTHCQEKVEAGEGFKHEDCVEEMFHMMHCVDEQVAPKLFGKLK